MSRAPQAAAILMWSLRYLEFGSFCASCLPADDSEVQLGAPINHTMLCGGKTQSFHSLSSDLSAVNESGCSRERRGALFQRRALIHCHRRLCSLLGLDQWVFWWANSEGGALWKRRALQHCHQGLCDQRRFGRQWCLQTTGRLVAHLQQLGLPPLKLLAAGACWRWS